MKWLPCFFDASFIVVGTVNLIIAETVWQYAAAWLVDLFLVMVVIANIEQRCREHTHD